MPLSYFAFNDRKLQILNLLSYYDFDTNQEQWIMLNIQQIQSFQNISPS